MSGITTLDSEIIYRNPKPYLRSRHAYFPTVVELPDGKLLAAMDIGSAFEAVDVRSYCCRSGDGGKTWSDPTPIFVPDTAAHPVSTTCRVSATGNDALVGWACLFDRSDPSVGMTNPQTQGFVRTDFAIVRSHDHGTTWESPEPVTLPMDWRHFETCSPIVAVDHDRWLALTSPWAAWDGAQTDAPEGIAWASSDAGQSWTEAVEVFARHDRFTAWEQKLVKLSDGRLLAVCWSYDSLAQKSRPNRYALSTDTGRSFGPAIDTPLQGETCTPVALDDNHFLCVYRRYDDPGLWAHLARIDGDKWVALADHRLWAGPGYGHAGDDHIMAQMAQLRFGCPSVIRLSSGDIFAAFWCVEDGVSNIRWFRLQLCGT